MYKSIDILILILYMSLKYHYPSYLTWYFKSSYMKSMIINAIVFYGIRIKKKHFFVIIDGENFTNNKVR